MESLKERIVRYIIAHKKAKEDLVREIDRGSVSFREFKEKLIKNNIISEEDILIVLSREYKIPYMDLDKYRISNENKNFLSKELSFRYRVLPISKIGDVLTVATANPLDVITLDDLRITAGFKKIDLVLSKEEKITKYLNSLYSETTIAPLVEENDINDDDVAIKDISLKDDQGLEGMISESKLPPVVRVVDLMIYEGLKRRASDIHIEPTQKDLSVRYRIDGVLHHGFSLPKKNQGGILARLKIMSSLNITEFRVPQDGRFKIKFENREIDFRVSSLPGNFGEKIVLRILDKESLAMGIKNLGFSPVPQKLFEESLEAPFGIILVTGPTGSGKSTTLYSIINQLNNAEKNIVTIEYPVEYQIEGITQIQVKPEIGLNFSSSLRSVLRQSPDIIMVGEIRDAETADIAIKASLTGEFIFSTLHTNNSVGAITRLVDMGIEPFLVASSMIATTAQRLARRLCTKCKIKEKTDQKLLERLNLEPVEELYRPAGCSFCNRTGYRGRIALLEILSFDDTIRTMILKKNSEDEITDYARKKRSFLSLKEDGFKKCIEGITTLEEVLRVAG